MDHLQANGFVVDKKDIPDSQLRAVKIKYKVPESLYSCHTAVAQSYVLEGHVPADLISRLLKEKSPIAGLAVPGMPIGSPGMEGGKPQPYEILSFDRQGQIRVYERR